MLMAIICLSCNTFDNIDQIVYVNLLNVFHEDIFQIAMLKVVILFQFPPQKILSSILNEKKRFYYIIIKLLNVGVCVNELVDKSSISSTCFLNQAAGRLARKPVMIAGKHNNNLLRMTSHVALNFCGHTHPTVNVSC